MTDKKSASSKNHEIKKIFKYIAFPDFSPFAPVTVPGFFFILAHICAAWPRTALVQ